MDWPKDVMETIYSGILRMKDLTPSIPDCPCHFYLVAPDQRKKDMLTQLARPAFRSDLTDISSLAFNPFNDLREHCDALCKFGEDHTIIQKVVRHHHLAMCH